MTNKKSIQKLTNAYNKKHPNNKVSPQEMKSLAKVLFKNLSNHSKVTVHTPYSTYNINSDNLN